MEINNIFYLFNTTKNRLEDLKFTRNFIRYINN